MSDDCFSLSFAQLKTCLTMTTSVEAYSKVHQDENGGMLQEEKDRNKRASRRQKRRISCTARYVVWYTNSKCISTLEQEKEILSMRVIRVVHTLQRRLFLSIYVRPDSRQPSEVRIR